MVNAGDVTGGGGVATTVRPRIKTRTKEVGYQVLVAVAHTLLNSLTVGASGAVVAFAAPAPTICFEIYSAWRENDTGLAQSKQESIVTATKRVVSELGIPAVKYAMDLNGYYGGFPPFPLFPLWYAQKSLIEGQMGRLPN